MNEKLVFIWRGSMFRFDTQVYVPDLDTAITLYAHYRKLDPKGLGNLWVEAPEDGFCTLWKSEFGETLDDMFAMAELEEV